MSDLVAQLRKYDAYMSEARERMVAAIRREFPNEERAEDEALVTRSIHREAADRIEQLEREVAGVKNGTPSEPGWLHAEPGFLVLSEARRKAFFVAWEMCQTAGAEDTCADAWEFWSLMEDGRDEVEGKR